MAAKLTDVEIAKLLAEPKTLDTDFRSRIVLRTKRGHKERELDIPGSAGGEFQLVLRQGSINPMDFSVILLYRVPGSSQLVRLRRYNGKSHDHTNVLESQSLDGFHIHTATERYQDSGLREDGYAEATDRYADLAGAVKCMLSDCGFVVPPQMQMTMFEGD